MLFRSKWGADRQFFYALKQNFSNYNCTNANTVAYRLDGNSNSVTEDFFKVGNELNEQKYNGEFPWKIKQHLLQVGPGISVVI